MIWVFDICVVVTVLLIFSNLRNTRRTLRRAEYFRELAAWQLRVETDFLWPIAIDAVHYFTSDSPLDMRHNALVRSINNLSDWVEEGGMKTRPEMPAELKRLVEKARKS